MYKITNKTYQPKTILLDGNTVVVGKRKSLVLNKITKQILNMKANGSFKVKKIK